MAFRGHVFIGTYSKLPVLQRQTNVNISHRYLRIQNNSDISRFSYQTNRIWQKVDSDTCLYHKFLNNYYQYQAVQYNSNEQSSRIIQGLKDVPTQDPASDDAKSQPRKKYYGLSIQAWGNIIFLVFFSLGMVMVIYEQGAPERDENGQIIIDEFSEEHAVVGYTKRFIKWCKKTKVEVTEPSYKKLLPDPLKEPYYQPKYTLVMEMNDVLVHPEWKWSTGWRFKRRPGVEYFLQQIGFPKFEVVIYTKENGMTAFPVIDQLDTQGHIPFRLFRDSTKYENFTHKKDLSKLNRDLGKIIIVDCDYEAVSLFPRNAVVLDKWTGDNSDQGLADLASFLNVLHTSGVDDIRDILDNFNTSGKNVLDAFNERRQAYLAMQQQKTAPPQPSFTSKFKL